MNRRSKESLNKTRDLCEWVVSHAGPPYMVKDKKSEEYKHARWLSNRRYSVKKGKEISSEELKILMEFNLCDIFSVPSSSLRSSSMSLAYNIWVETQGFEPRPNGSELEKVLYRWVSRKRSGETDTYKEDTECLLVQNLLDSHSREVVSNFLALKLCLFMANGSKPKRNSEDEEEKMLSRWLSNKRQGYKGKSRSKVYQSDLDILKEHDLLKVLE